MKKFLTQFLLITVLLLTSSATHASSMQIFINQTIGTTLTLDVESNDTIESVKQQIEDIEGIPVYLQKLVFAGLELDNDRTLSDYNIQTESLLNLFLALTPDQNNVLYVNQNVTESDKTGSSWVNAIPELRDALSWAGVQWDSDTDGPLQIWVAEGLYLPVDNPSSRTATFQLVNNVHIYGGFAGGESSLEARDWNANATILSGDIDENDFPFDPHTDSDGNPDTPSQTDHIVGTNSYSVVTSSGTDNTAILDGFIITAGLFKVNVSPYDKGAGIFNDSGHPILRNLSISGNRAQEGGGMYNSSSNPKLVNVTIDNNTSVTFGGGMSNDASSPSLTNVRFLDNNSMDAAGGGMYNKNSSNPNLINVSFSGNIARDGGGMANLDNSSPILINVTFTDNRANGNGGGIFNLQSSNPTLVNVVLWNNEASGDIANPSASILNANSVPSISHSLIANSGGSGNWNSDLGNNHGNNIDADPLFTDPENGDFTLIEGSPAVNAGDPSTDLSLFPGGSDAPLDLAGNPRVSSGNIDMGAYEFQGLSPVVASIEISGAPGWRMLGAPVTDVTVVDLANQNLIQGIPGLQYEDFDANLFIWNPVAETGDPEDPFGAYVSPDNGSNVLNSGTGFIWFMWGELEDVADSKPFPLTLELTGMEPAGDVSLGTLPEGWNLIANPFAESIAFDELTNGTDLLNVPGYVWDPNEGSSGSYFLTTSADLDNTLSVWEGAFIELNADSEVMIPQSSKQAAGMLAKGDSNDEPKLSGQIEFMLEALSDGNGAQTRDRAAILYFHEQATEGWDSWDVSKLIPLSHAWATASFLGERDGKPVLKAQHALPYHIEGQYEVSMDIQLQNTGGSFRLSWPVVVNLPEDAEITLLDTHTGQQFDLGREGHVDFAMEGEGTQTSPPSLFQQPEIKSMELKDNSQRFVVIVNPTATSTNSGPELPAEVALAQNYPNPFNPTTIIRYELPESQQVRLEVYDISGRLISTLVNDQVTAGTHTVTFDAQHLASGIYVYRLQAGGMVISRKLTLIK